MSIWRNSAVFLFGQCCTVTRLAQACWTQSQVLTSCCQYWSPSLCTIQVDAFEWGGKKSGGANTKQQQPRVYFLVSFGLLQCAEGNSFHSTGNELEQSSYRKQKRSYLTLYGQRRTIFKAWFSFSLFFKHRLYPLKLNFNHGSATFFLRHEKTFNFLIFRVSCKPAEAPPTGRQSPRLRQTASRCGR